jgi:hypothetical protein
VLASSTTKEHIMQSLTFARAARWIGPALAAAALLPTQASAQAKSFLVPGTEFPATTPLPCKGKVTQVADLAFEGTKTTAWNFANVGGGGIGGRFDPLPVLSTAVTLQAGCLNAHFSAMAGNQVLYGVSNMTLFEITLSGPSGALIPMTGHYPTPYGLPSPAVALSAEYDVDMLGANFYMPVGSLAGQIKPGTYKVNVWWAGGPTAAGGAIGAAFVLKMYQQ